MNKKGDRKHDTRKQLAITDRRRKIVALSMASRTCPEIANLLAISERTVKRDRHHMRALAVKDLPNLDKPTEDAFLGVNDVTDYIQAQCLDVHARAKKKDSPTTRLSALRELGSNAERKIRIAQSVGVVRKEAEVVGFEGQDDFHERMSKAMTRCIRKKDKKEGEADE